MLSRNNGQKDEVYEDSQMQILQFLRIVKNCNEKAKK